MSLIWMRVFFIIVCSLVGFQLGGVYSTMSGRELTLAGLGIGIAAALLIIIVEVLMRRVSVKGLSAAVFGLIFGLIMALLLSFALNMIPMTEILRSSLRVILLLIFCYLGMVIAMRGKDEFNLVIPYVRLTRQDVGTELIILDTSVIIDGRIADISQTKFIEGRFLIPRFVLKELQQIADSKDGLKRNRGRRGLEILGKIQKNPHIDVRIHEEDFPDMVEVDAKLIKLATVLNAKLFTNDFNLSKVAELQGIKVLNINELANALKPIVLPGEMMEVKVVKEGKEYNQGIGYLDDGTMIVVENGKHLLGQAVKTTVTSVLQTTAGRMIFTKPANSRKSHR
ncbi:MAG: TRAM domain-containing protein [Candidatus Omnitrophica bacterium]|nr:TRAM domain-containing protein [Candidatus Omnitrophota bacterium]MBU4140812.1 TRAM domain-containing protein [Candidatus Omnitrophota bacterium]